MYQHIMVPLDGSKVAECVIPHVEALVKGCEVKRVTFIRVVEPLRLSGIEGWLSEEQRERLARESKSEAWEYLNQVMSRFNYEGVGARTVLLTGGVADSLVDWAEKNNVDLIVIATHGRSAVSRWVWGSVADRILRSACVPVLMIRAPGCVPGI